MTDTERSGRKNENTLNNQVNLTGKIMDVPIFSHEVYGEKFYQVSLTVKRLSDVVDVIPVTVSERLMTTDLLRVGKEITVIGQFRSYNKLIDSKSKLMLTVFASDVMQPDYSRNSNTIELTGFLCKPPIFRTTPFNREITDILIAVNRAYNKSDYIPCIAWGRNARFIKYMTVGQRIKISGRIQSREYIKKISETQSATMTAYEVSVCKVDVVGDEVDLNAYEHDYQTVAATGADDN